MERDVSGGGGKVPVIVTAAVALAGLIALVPGLSLIHIYRWGL